MRRTIDDLPMVKASTLRAHGYIGPETKTTSFVSMTCGVEYQVRRDGLTKRATSRISVARPAGARNGVVVIECADALLHEALDTTIRVATTQALAPWARMLHPVSFLSHGLLAPIAPSYATV